MAADTSSTVQPPSEIQTISIELKPTLSDEQKKIVTFVYDSAKEFATEILNKSALSDAMKVTQMMGSIMKMMESLTFNQAKVEGSTKKAVALELGRKLICDLVKEEALQTAILLIYDTTAEPILETMIDVSRNVNVVLDKAVSCCDSVFECLKKK